LTGGGYGTEERIKEKIKCNLFNFILFNYAKKFLNNIFCGLDKATLRWSSRTIFRVILNS